MTVSVQELTERVVARLAEQNDGRDLTRIATPIVQATLVELAAEGYLGLSTEES